MIAPEDYMVQCLNKTLFGFECMGCGGQRAVLFLFKGEFIAAFKMYPAIYMLIPLFLLIAVNLFYKFKYSLKIINVLAILSVGIIIINYVIKLIN